MSSDKRKPTLALAAITGTEIDKLAAGADPLRDLGAVGTENRTLRARRIILGQRADRTVEGTSQIVVEIFWRNARWRSTQSGNERVPLGGGVDLETMNNAVTGHSTVRRDRTNAEAGIITCGCVRYPQVRWSRSRCWKDHPFGTPPVQHRASPCAGPRLPDRCRTAHLDAGLQYPAPRGIEFGGGEGAHRMMKQRGKQAHGVRDPIHIGDDGHASKVAPVRQAKLGVRPDGAGRHALEFRP